MKSETRLEILQDLKKEQEQYIRDIDYTLENINYDPDDEDNTNYREYCELEDIQTGHRQIVKALDETIYFLQNIEELEEKIKYLEKANEWVDVSKNGTPKENSMCAVMVEGDRFDGSEFVPDIDLLPYFVFYNSEEDYWVDVDGVIVPTEIVAWKKIEPDERKN